MHTSVNQIERTIIHKNTYNVKKIFILLTKLYVSFNIFILKCKYNTIMGEQYEKIFNTFNNFNSRIFASDDSFCLKCDFG